jgi:hypothetical protein
MLQRIAPTLATLTLTTLIATSLMGASFPDSAVPLPPNWSGPVFHLSQNYPQQIRSDRYPWTEIDPVKEPERYLNTVLRYCLEGNVDADWVLQQNKVRPWLHAPWMHWGDGGREPIHGLTMERTSQPAELAPSQTSKFQNWAVGMYNAPGGYTIGRVWEDATDPDPKVAHFPANTVSIKLLFTAATVDQVPTLRGSKEWQAYIYADLAHTKSGDPRIVKTLHLLQVDIAVREPRVDYTTGWVFGTFISDGRVPGSDPYAKLKPVGVMWGDDPKFGPTEFNQQQKPNQGWINPEVKPIMQHYGWLGRLDGPVDNPKSSCLSCHSTGERPGDATILPTEKDGTTVPPEGSARWMRWFRNIKAGEPFDARHHSLDYSLQLAFGIRNEVLWANGCLADPSPTVVPPCPTGIVSLTASQPGTAAKPAKVTKPAAPGYPVVR